MIFWNALHFFRYLCSKHLIMARKPTTFDPVALEFLKEFVKRKVNLSCNSFSHIQQLEESIRLTTGEFLSLQTLNRLFGIIPNGFNPSLNTLDTLAHYTGFHSFADITAIAENRPENGKESTDISRILASLFNMTGSSPEEEPGIFLVMENLCGLIHKDVVLGKLIYAQMARSYLGRKYLFERLVFIDQLAGVYGDALPVCLLYASDREQTFFILSMLCYKSFFMGDIARFKSYFKILLSYPQSEVMQFMPHIVDRYYAVMVMDKMYGNTMQGFEGGLQGMAELDFFSSPHSDHQHAGFLLGEALLLTGDFERAYELLNETDIEFISIGAMDKTYHEAAVSVYKLVSGYFSQRINPKRAYLMCRQLLDGPMPLLARDFLSLVLLCLLIQLELKSTEKKICRDKIDVLVTKTKFTFFYSFLEICDRAKA